MKAACFRASVAGRAVQIAGRLLFLSTLAVAVGTPPAARAAGFPPTTLTYSASSSPYATPPRNVFPDAGQCTWYVYGRVQELADAGALRPEAATLLAGAFTGQTGRHARCWPDFIGGLWMPTPLALDRRVAGLIAVWVPDRPFDPADLGSYGHVGFVEEVSAEKTHYRLSDFNRSGDESYRNQWYESGKDTVLGVKPTFYALATASALPPSSGPGGTVVGWGSRVLPHVVTGTRFIAIAAGAYHSLAVKGNDTVAVWGRNIEREGTVPEGLRGVVAVAGGETHSLALKNDGTVVAWGYHSSGQTNVPADLVSVVKIAAGSVHSLALKSDGTVRAWGATPQSSVPVGLTGVVDIASARYHSLVAKNDGTVTAWGYNDWGQTTVPSDLRDVVAVAAGYAHSLALKSDGTVVAWGAGTNNTGAYPNLGQSMVPSGLGEVVGIAAGFFHSLALKRDGTVVAWGAGTEGLRDSGYNWGQSTVPSSLSAVVAIAAGAFHSLALKSDGTIAAWGADDFWQSPVLELSGMVAIAAGSIHGLGLKTNGTVVAWGPDVEQRELLEGLDSVLAIAAGNEHSLALKSDGTVMAAGRNWEGESTVPTGLNGVVAIAGGGWHSLALKSDGTVVKWGLGGTNVPAGMSGVVAVAGGGHHSLALRSDGTVVAWGDDSDGQSTVPADLSGVVAIAGGGNHSLALKNDGRVVAWGDNSSGQCTVPVGLSGVLAIAGGSEYSLALKSDGTVVAWGRNDWNQSTVPAGLSGVVAIAGGNYNPGANYNSLGLVQDSFLLPIRLSGVSPNPVPGRNGRQWLSLLGEGFVPQSRVTLRTGGEVFVIAPERTEYISTTQLRIYVNVTEAAAAWTAEVRNPDGSISERVPFNVERAALTAVTSVQVSGPPAVFANSRQEYTAQALLANGTTLEVSEQARWLIDGPAPAGVELAGNELSVGDLTVEGVVQLQAQYTHPGGRRVSGPFTVTLQPRARVDFTGRAIPITSPIVGWRLELEATVYGANASDFTFAWDTDNDGAFDDATGRTPNLSLAVEPGTHTVRLQATRTGEPPHVVERSVVFDRAGPVNEPPVVPAPDAGIGRLVNSSGQPFAFDSPAKKTNGFVLVTHGLRASGDASWIRETARGIEDRLADDVPYVAIHDWHKWADPVQVVPEYPSDYGQSRWRDSIYLAYFTLAESADLVARKSGADFVADILSIRPQAIRQGGYLAEWFQQQIALGNIDTNKPIHLIGHSAGGFLVGQCALLLMRRGINVRQVTTLDTPLPDLLFHLQYPNPGRIDRYYASFGYLDSPFGVNSIEQSACYYPRQPAGFRFPLNAKKAHEDLPWWYLDTVRDDSVKDGFHYSPLLAPPVGNPFPSAGSSLLHAEGADQTITERALGEFQFFGTTVESNGVYTITEESNAGLFRQVELPIGVQQLRFRYRFTSPGDGDFLSVYWDTNEVLYLGSDLDLSREDFVEADALLAHHAGGTNQLVFRLVSRGQKNAVLVLHDIRFTVSDNPDRDGLKTDDELARGTNPLRADTDGDGLTDGEEITLNTNPLLSDTDSDGMSDGTEVAGGFAPLDGQSALRVSLAWLAGSGGIELSWPGDTNRTYRVNRTKELSQRDYTTLTNGLPGALPLTRFTDALHTNATAVYWVQME